MGSPCFRCQKRTSECHSNCVLYLGWKEEHDKEKAVFDKLNQERIVHNYYKHLIIVKTQNKKHLTPKGKWRDN